MPHWGVMQPARRIFLLEYFSWQPITGSVVFSIRWWQIVRWEWPIIYTMRMTHCTMNMIHVVWSSLTPGCSMSFLCVSVHCTGDCQTTISFSSTSICFISHLDKKYACYCCFIIFVIFINCDLRRSPYLSVDAQSAIAFWTWRRQHDRKQAAYDRVHMHLRPIVWQQLNMA